MFKGIITPMITILDDHGKFDYEGNKTIINHLINSGVSGILVLGSIGEFFSFTPEEKKEFTRFAIETVNKRVPILIGTGGMIMEEVIDLNRYAEMEGADGVVMMSPYYFHLDDESLYRYYGEIANATKLPILLYNFPDRTGYYLSTELILKLAKNYRNIVGIKDTIDGISHTRKIINTVKTEVKDFKVLSGFDEFLIPNLIAGGDGVIGGLQNVAPKLFADIMEACDRKDLTTLSQLQQKVGILMDVYKVSSPFIPAIKAATLLMGTEITTNVKAPSQPLSDKQFKQVKDILIRAGLLN